MPRRRLHGETQKRRKKRVTRDLKRQETIIRPQVTQQPAPFEGSEKLGREDLEFQEAMRELDVQRTSRRSESTQRRNAVEGVQFQIDEGDRDGFDEHMAQMGVRPMKGGTRKLSKDDNSQRGKGAEDPGMRPVVPSEPVATMPAESKPAESLPDRDASESTLTASQGTAPQGTAPSPAPPGRPMMESKEEDSRAGDYSVEDSFTRFGTEDQDLENPESMEALLAASEFDPGEKFEGAPKLKAIPGHASRPSPFADEHLEPDSELDLHGKTQEEAIAMVQNFLLTSHRQRLRHVLIITGKGLNSGQGGPVLKEAVSRWLERNGHRFASGFFPAPPRHGGEGALWVTLR